VFLWWLGNVVLLVVVVPVVVVLLRGVAEPTQAIERTSQELAGAGPVLLDHLDAVTQLVTTQELCHSTSAGLDRYGAALDRLL
jgi:hypothetical protein